MSRNKSMPPPPASVPEVVEKEVAPAMKKPDSSPKESDSIKVVAQAKSGIEVVALREGFFNSSRKVAGDKFFVPSMEKLGTWMKCVNPDLEKQHQEMMRANKARKWVQPKAEKEAGE